MRILKYSAGACALLLLLTSVMNAEQQLTNAIWSHYVALTIGFVVGFAGRDMVSRRPWLLLILPLVAIAIGLALF